LSTRDVRPAHRTERGSAGSNVIEVVIGEVDPALPRSVLCVPREKALRDAEGPRQL